MHFFKKFLVPAAACSWCLAFFGAVACSSDESPDNSQPVEPITPGDTGVVVNPETGDTLPATRDSIRDIDPITGDTVYKIDTIYIPKDTTLHWVGNSALVISEIAPINLNWKDENGDDPGWVEIYNAGNVAANLKGYSLIENRKEARKWVFGDELIAAKSFRIVFCDKKNLSEALPGADTDSAHFRPHTNWKLEKNGGTVYLVDNYYGIRDSVTYPALASGVSYGIVDGGGYKYFAEPTPEEPNNVKTSFDGMAPTFTFNGSQGGFYKDEVTLNPPSAEGVQIRCTQDGSSPTKDSKEFNEPITIDQNTVLRCAVYKDGLITKDVVTNTYFIGEQVNMPVVAVSIDPKFLSIYNKKSDVGGCGPSCSPELYEEVEYPVHIEYFAEGSASTEKAFEVDAGLEFMGGWSRLEPKKSVSIKLREQYEDGWIHYPLFETRKGVNDKYKAFNLRNNGNRFVSDYLEDAIGGAMLEGSDVDYQRSRQVVVFYNGKYYGIHDMRERFNKNFVETNYNIDANTVNFIKHISHEVTASNGTIDDYKAMLSYFYNNDMTLPENYATARTLVDIGNFADYMAAEIFFHNGDWPNNNVRAWKSPEHPWKFMAYDLDHGFNWAWVVTGFSSGTNMFKWIKQGGGGDKPCNNEGCFASLYNQLIKNENFKRLFINRSAVMFENYVNGKRATEIAAQMASTMNASDVERDMDVEAYKNRRMSYGDFDKDGSGIAAWAVKRDAIVKSEYESEFGLSDPITISINSSGNGTVLMEGMNLPGGTANSTNYKGEFFGGIPMELTAVPAAGAVFAGWSDGATENPHLVTPTDGMSITATFK